MSQGAQELGGCAQELGHTWIMKHMNYKVHNTCHHEFGGILIISELKNQMLKLGFKI